VVRRQCCHDSMPLFEDDRLEDNGEVGLSVQEGPLALLPILG
jgi:hypothetical protein